MIDLGPELRDGGGEILALLGRAVRSRELIFFVKSVVEIDAEAAELALPGAERVRLVALQHVAHGEGEGVEVVLDAQQLERVAAITVDEITLHLAEVGDLEPDVPRVDQHGAENDDQGEQQSPGRGAALIQASRHAARMYGQATCS